MNANYIVQALPDRSTVGNRSFEDSGEAIRFAQDELERRKQEGMWVEGRKMAVIRKEEGSSASKIVTVLS